MGRRNTLDPGLIAGLVKAQWGGAGNSRPEGQKLSCKDCPQAEGTVTQRPGAWRASENSLRSLGDRVAVDTNVKNSKSRSGIIKWKVLELTLLSGVGHLLRISQE